MTVSVHHATRSWNAVKQHERVYMTHGVSHPLNMISHRKEENCTIWWILQSCSSVPQPVVAIPADLSRWLGASGLCPAIECSRNSACKDTNQGVQHVHYWRGVLQKHRAQLHAQPWTCRELQPEQKEIVAKRRKYGWTCGHIWALIWKLFKGKSTVDVYQR